MVVVVAPSQTVWSATLLRVGVGFTVIWNVWSIPTQFAAVGVTVIVAVTGAELVFTAVNTGKLSFPVAPSPMLGSLFAHE